MIKKAVYLITMKNNVSYIGFFVEIFNKMIWISMDDEGSTKMGIVKSDTKSIKKIYET